jgi:hypothetical protein
MTITKKPDPIGIHINDINRQKAASQIQALVRGRTQRTVYVKLKIDKARNEFNELLKQVKKNLLRVKPPKRANQEQANSNMWQYIKGKNPKLAEQIIKKI